MYLFKKKDMDNYFVRGPAKTRAGAV